MGSGLGYYWCFSGARRRGRLGDRRAGTPIPAMRKSERKRNMKSRLSKFGPGVIVPMVTPLNRDESVDLDAVAPFVDFLVGGGVDGVFALGTTGEISRLDPNECRRAIEATVVAVDGRVPVYAGISAHAGTRQTLENLKQAEESGADFVVVTLPYYFPIEDEGEQIDFFLRVADAATCGVLLYNIPWTVVASIKTGTIERLVQHPNIIGIKDSSGDVDYFNRLLSLRDPDAFRVLCGHEGLFDPALLRETDGMVSSSANILPASVSKAWKNIRSAAADRYLARIEEVNALNGCAPYSSTAGLVLRKLVLGHLNLIQPVTTHPHTRFAQGDLEKIEALARKVAAWEGVGEPIDNPNGGSGR